MSVHPRPLVLVLALLALGALVWLVILGGGGSPAEEGPATAGKRTPGAGQEASLSGTAEPGIRTTIPVPGSPEDETGGAADKTAHLQVRVVSKVAGDPVAGAELFLWLGASFREFPPTGAGGGRDVAVPAGVPFQAGVRAPEGNAPPDARPILWKDVAALAPGEHRTLVFEIPLGFDQHLFGRVVDGTGGAPIPGARIALLEDGSLVLDTTSGPDGRFDLPVRTISHPVLQIEAQGFGAQFRELPQPLPSAERPFPVRLFPAATLSGKVFGPWGPQGGAEVAAATPAAAPARFPNAVLFQAPGPAWRTKSDARGAYRLQGLPARVPLTFTVTLPGAAARPMPGQLVLEPGEERRADWNLGSLANLEGLALDQDAKPVAGLPVLALPAGPEARERPHLFEPPRGDADEVPAAVTDADGKFLLENLPPGRWLVGVDSRRPLPETLADVSPAAEPVVLAENTPRAQMVLHVARGLYITGRVEGPQGEPLAHATVSAGWRWSAAVQAVSTEPGGAFRLGPLLPHGYVVRASIPEAPPGLADSEPVEAFAGEDGVVLRLRRGGALVGKLVDAATGQPVAGTVRLAWPAVRTAATLPDGTFRIGGLAPFSYSLLAQGRNGGAAFLPYIEVEASAAPQEVVVELQPAATLVVRALPALGANNFQIQAPRGQIFWEVLLHGVPVSVQVPPGKLEILLQRDYEPLATRKVTLAVGERREIVFEKQD